MTHEIVFFFYSYWDWLPVEIQDFIILLAVSQQLIDLRRKKERQILHDKLRAYHRLQNAWALGYIRWTNCRQEGTQTHRVLKGFYVDIEKKERSVLGQFFTAGTSKIESCKIFPVESQVLSLKTIIFKNFNDTKILLPKFDFIHK